MPVVPLGDRKLRACLATGLIKTEEQWFKDGHDIFGYIRMAEDRDVVHEFTSPNFDGMVAIMEPKNSWVARWQGVQNFVPGCYALRVRGTLPSQWATLLEDEGFKYEPLDEDAPVAPPETI
jgi:transcription elongation factor SPT4